MQTPRVIYSPTTADAEGQLYVITPSDATPPGATLVMKSSDSRFTEAVEVYHRAKHSDLFWSKLYKLMAPLVAVQQDFKEVHPDVTFTSGNIYYKGKAVFNDLTKNIIQLYKEGASVDGLVKFLIKLESNPSMKAKNALFAFLAHGRYPITDEGNIIGYKSVNGQYLDWHSRTIPNKIGVPIPPFKRGDVDDDPDTPCSLGYHIGTWDFASNFNIRYDDYHLMIVEFKPENVVSVPSDGDVGKLRVTEYEVIGETTLDKGPLPAPMYRTNTTEPASCGEDSDDSEGSDDNDDDEDESGFKDDVYYQEINEIADEWGIDSEDIEVFVDDKPKNYRRLKKLADLLWDTFADTDEIRDWLNEHRSYFGDSVLNALLRGDSIKAVLKFAKKELAS